MNENINNPNTGNDALNTRILEIKRRAYGNFHRYIRQLYEASRLEQTNKDKKFIDMLKDNIKLIIDEKYNTNIEIEIEDAFRNLDSSDKEKLIDTATEITIALITKYLSLSELETRLLERHLTMHGFKKLSRGLTYDIISDNESMELHVPTTFFENSGVAIESYKKGLAILARKLQEDPTLQNIKKICGHSSLVQKKRLIMEQLGFELDYEEIDGLRKPTGHASISREKLIALYGKDEEK
ncbi:hypothetical protein COU49_02715 [Candidatus Nomurabacteria bacterium CG10_big_fil_rev_8_21_14_0_10_35_16]|uniref:Uncharacterized protein n=1 Tax=Candidatus Nomurabacteria bacterium CG10_big_fil_rev_8_21_14_0_10_35_16 TaxID=1974731 RepID=A0A2H0TAL5_9BACT|nr:MAG: hypothetical protein COU49_02715 [Candidatus Nomurabacteria bacterium CG10_big_fil_rev_8_21_14_0_10_35_16]